MHAAQTTFRSPTAFFLEGSLCRRAFYDAERRSQQHKQRHAYGWGFFRIELTERKYIPYGKNEDGGIAGTCQGAQPLPKAPSAAP